MKQKYFGVRLVLFAIISFLFFNVSTAKADSCQYGIICIYKGCVTSTCKSASSGTGLQYNATILGVVYRCDSHSTSISDCEEFESWAYLAENNIDSDASGVAEEVNNWVNYDSMFGGPSDSNYYSVNLKMQGYFSSRTSYYCPSMYGSYSTAVINGGYYFSNGSGTSLTYMSQSSSTCISEDDSDSDVHSQLVELVTGATEDAYNVDTVSDYIDSLTETDSSDSDGSIIEKIVAWGSSTLGLDYDLSSDSCSLISAEVREFLGDVFSYMSIIGIVILVIMTGINVVKVITASEDDALKGFLKNLWKRIVCLIILLLLPMLVTFIIQVVNGVADIWGVNSDDPLCSITE